MKMRVSGLMLRLVLCALALMLLAWSMATAQPDYATGQIIVKLISKMGQSQFQVQSRVVSTGLPSLDERIQRYGVYRATQIFPYKSSELGQIYQLDFEAKRDAAEVAADFAIDEHLLYAEPRYFQQLHEVPNDEYYLTGIQWYIDIMQCPMAWDMTHGDSSSIIAIVDTGVDWNHPDLQANMWMNPGEDLDGDGRFSDYDRNMIDDDSNGYVDDWCGWDFSGAGYPDNDPMEWGPVHGTHVAGCAAAVTNNGLGVAGVGWDCSIMAVKTAEDGEENIRHGYEGILYAADNGADVINASWGRSSGAPSQFEQEIIDSANARGAIIISSAGNEPGVSPPDTCQIEYPAWYHHVVAVAATDQSDKAASWTFYGSWVDVAAPGQAIYNTWYDDHYAMLQGTSMSSPLVAGIAALLRSIDIDMTSDEFAAKMWHTSDDIYAINSHYLGRLGGGRVNARKAVLSMINPNLIVQESVIDDSGGNDDGRPDPGESISWTVTLGNTPTWQSAQNLRVKIISDHPLITFSQDSAAFGDIAPGESSDNSTTPFCFSIAADDSAYWTTFYLQMEADGVVDSMQDSVKMFIGRPAILIVDDDGGDDLENSYQHDLDIMAVLYETWQVAEHGKVQLDELMRYDVAIWLTGAESESTLTDDDQSHLASFLDAGHCLFLSGQNIGDEVGQSSFFRQYLHVSHLSDSISLDPPYLDGMPEDTISAEVTLMLSGSEPQVSPDGIQAIDEGVNIFTYRSAPEYAAATRYESPEGYKVVYFAFGYEGIQGSDVYTHGPVLLKKILHWFQVATGFVDEPDPAGLPRQYVLWQNYPNPFNAETFIKYILPPMAGHHGTTLRIYNILGQEIRTLVDEVQGPGIHLVQWDGRDEKGQEVSTAVYFCRLQNGSFGQTKKMVLLR